MKNSFVSTMYYIVDYLIDGIQQRHVFKPVDAANGVIFDSVPDKEDWVWAQRSTGQVVELPVTNVLMVEQYDVHWRNNQGSGRNSTWSEDDLVDHLNANVKENGVVETPLSNIKDDSGNTVYSKHSSSDESQKSSNQMSLL